MSTDCILFQLEMEDDDTIDVFQQQTGGHTLLPCVLLPVECL